jgi:hypothetical protein
VTALNDLLALERDDSVPLFYVQEPDGRRDWAEIDRQVVLFRVMRMAAPLVLGYAIPNAGKRNPAKARKESIMAGIFDTEWQWEGGSAHLELKGYSQRRAGKLSQSQIDYGNRMHRMGKRVACFFCPYDAAHWLREQGAPVGEFRVT